MNRVCWDMETLLFSNDFKYAKTIDDRRKHAPKMRVACVFSEATGAYDYFLPESAGELIACLVQAEESISYNGKGFDLLVLQRHYGLSQADCDKINALHVDLFEVAKRATGSFISLHRLAQLNLQETKQVQGQNMADLPLEALKEACRSDVSQTYRLWQLHQRGELKFPGRS
jgi:hypothetical protein